MILTLTMLRCPPTVVPDVRQLSGGEFSIGRSPDSDWVLPDSDKEVSRRHCVIAFRNGAWSIAGTSANGTFLNRGEERLEETGPRVLAHGDRIRFGAYEIEVGLDDQRSDPGIGHAIDHPIDHAIGHGIGHAAGRPVGQPRAGGFGAGGGFSSPFGDGFGDDPFAPPPAVLPPAPEMGFSAPSLPADFNPLLPEEEAFLSGPTAPDHAPAVSDAVNLPWPKVQLPNDWDLDEPPAAPEPRNAPPAAPLPDMPSPIPTPGIGAPPMPVPRIGIPASAPERAPPAPAQAAPPAAPTPAAPTPAAPTPAAPTPDLLAAFLRGAGLEGVNPADAEQTMERLGAAFRALVAGLRQALITRSSTKREFRIGATMIQVQGNNPLKFSANDDDALIGLLGVGRRSDMSPEEAVRDALDDICQHELATMPAMQAAVRALVTRLGPEAIQKEAETGGGLALLGNRKARAWDAYEALHGQIARGLTDNFDSVFGKQFALAYEQIVEELAAGRRNRR
ncbi:type VI secretion system-associated FHA domain protein TagH [Rhodopila sp.]|uniref:type VI secretion system-associated FHA domain protein TagH n=1 Tax=Rhodopila sp. TaxID=2480087 RepID=UPI002CA4BC63|nr:type VI secretion system-associated FHA domain protein TagH [Rhodopila sp.]HVZ09619.1 type VI secretion system-associated FHA domain protein TagH [Rhodopila sp.]